MEFGTLDEFKSALREYSIFMGKEFKWKKNDKKRPRAKCKKTSCDWEIYCAKNELLRSNPGSTVKINTVPSPEGPPQFHRLYICLAGYKKGFVAGCRPFIGLDGCFLKSAFGGNLLSAVGVDGNNHIFVIAYAVVDIENKDNWKCFLTLLHEDLGDYKHNGRNFMLEMQKYRRKPIITMLEEIRSYIMRTMVARKVKLSGKLGSLCPVQYKRLEKKIHFANQWTPIWCGDNMGLRYEVHMWGNKVEVNLAEWTCTCRVWQLTGMLCRHAIATITHKGGKPEDMCHEWLSIEAYNKTYQHFIEPVQGPQYWAQTQYAHPVPPHKRVQRGRPKKNRRRFVDEDNVIGHRLKRKLTDFTCGRCDQANHNIRSCKNIGVPIRPKKYVAPPTSNEDDHLLSLDKQALNEAEEAVARVQQDPVEINLSQPNLSQDSDIELMVNICHKYSNIGDCFDILQVLFMFSICMWVPTTIVPPIARNKLNITRAKQRKVANKDDTV
ncbi:hypothetical protein HKD37_03G007225 [Glycine soja]